MGRHPVQDHADAGLMHPVHEIPEIIRRAVAGCGGIEAGHLIAPGQIEGMLTDTHQLHMGKAHIGQVLRQIIRVLGVVHEPVFIVFIPEPFFPGSQIHLIDGHRPLDGLCIVPLCLMNLIMPLVVVQAGHD